MFIIKNFKRLAVLLLIMAAATAGCNNLVDTNNEENIDYPIDIPFTEYSNEALCQWLRDDFHCRISYHWEEILSWEDVLNCLDRVRNELIIINSNNELEKYLRCTDVYNPVIDFSKHTLLLARGTTYTGISGISKQLQCISENEYRLDIDILLNDATVAENWTIALLINKLREKSNVQLNTTNNSLPLTTLTGASWKLAGIVDTKTGELNELGTTHYCDGGCFTISFVSNSVALTNYRSSDRCLWEIVISNSRTSGGPQPPGFITDEDGNRIPLYCEHLTAYQIFGYNSSYLLNNNEFKIFDENNSKYLFYKRIEQ